MKTSKGFISSKKVFMPDFMGDIETSSAERVNELEDVDTDFLNTDTILQPWSDGKIVRTVSNRGKHELSSDSNNDDTVTLN